MSIVGYDMMGDYAGESDDLENGARYDPGERKWLAAHLIQVRALVERLLESRNDHYAVRALSSGVEKLVCVSATGVVLRKLLNAGCVEACTYAAMDLDPYLRAYHEASRAYYQKLDYSVNPASAECERLNQVIRCIRESFDGRAMRALNQRLSRAAAKRAHTAAERVSALRVRYAKLACVRVDLEYREGRFIDSHDFQADLREVKEHWQRFRMSLSKGVPLDGMVGFFSRLEYGVLTGFHFHGLFIFDGSKHQQDITIGTMLGEHWVRSIVPDGEGRYWNCNAVKDYPELGIGILRYYDDEKYRTLSNIVLGYMAKTDLLMAESAPGERTYFQSKETVQRVKLGRPRRKYVNSGPVQPGSSQES